MNRHERFMAKVNMHPGDMCWNWAGARGGSGYGQFWDGERNIPAHWFLLESRPPKGKEACHKCDNKLCVRPSHIFIGSRSDNMKDMVSKGRHNTAPSCRAMLRVRRVKNGQSNHEAILSDADAATIKAIKPRYGRGVLVAKHFKVSPTVVSGIWSGKRWAQIVPDVAAAERAKAFLLAVGKWQD